MPTFKRTLEIDAPPSEVWRVLTTPELVREWACAYLDGISIRTSWREGDRVAWKAPDGSTVNAGEVAAFKPERLLQFDYGRDPAASDTAPAEVRTFSDIFELEPVERRTRLRITTGPLDDAELKTLKRRADQAIEEIKSLAEESAQIHRAILPRA